MGNAVTLAIPSTTTAGIDSYVSELGEVQYERSLGSARFLKAIKGRHKEGPVVVKIFVKSEPTFSLQAYVQQLKVEKTLLAEVPNVCAHQLIVETDRAGYLVRQYFFSNLYDRISTRPFLNLIEKRWIAYQLLRGVADVHGKGVCHGDIKAENVLVTSWNWVYLTDFASFKPTYLPEDNPSDFSFYYDTSTRRTCYIAPERFFGPSEEAERRSATFAPESGRRLEKSMDIFALGCVIAELFLEGTHIFTLSQLLRYRREEYDPTTALDKIEDADIKEIITHMIQLDPTKRYTAEKYLAIWRGKVFPDYFYTFLHQYIASITDPHAPATHSSHDTGATGTDSKIERIHQDFDKIAFFLGFYGGDRNGSGSFDDKENRLEGQGNRKEMTCQSNQDLLKTYNEANAAWGAQSVKANVFLPVKLNIPHYHHQYGTQLPAEETDEGAVIFLSLVFSCIRNTLYPSTRLYALDLLLAIGEHLTDEIRLDRLVPYLITLMGDEVGLVRAGAIKALTQLLEMVNNLTPINCTVFPEYILPHLKLCANDQEALVRATYAACIASLAETALRFLELAQGFRCQNSQAANDDEEEDDLHYEASYESWLKELQMIVQEHVTLLLIDSESIVKRTLLGGITRLCVFFGRQRANDVLLSHMITYLNDRDWMLRCAFFESIVGVGTFVGGRSLEEYILPLMVQALTDAEEFVVEKVLNSFTGLAEIGLFQKRRLQSLIKTVAPLACHPSIWVRNAALAFISSGIKLLPLANIWCMAYPVIKPFLKGEVADFDELELLENVKPPLSRLIFNQAVMYAGRAGHDFLARPMRKHAHATGDEREQEHIIRLRELGMSVEDEEKLLAMREYIVKLAMAKLSIRPRSSLNELVLTTENGYIPLKNLGVTPRTVFLTPLQPEKSKSRTSKAKEISREKTEVLKLLTEGGQLFRAQSPLRPTGRTSPLYTDRNLQRTASEGTLPSMAPNWQHDAALPKCASTDLFSRPEGSHSAKHELFHPVALICDYARSDLSPSPSTCTETSSDFDQQSAAHLLPMSATLLPSATCSPSRSSTVINKAAAETAMTNANATATLELPSNFKSSSTTSANSALVSLSSAVEQDVEPSGEDSAASRTEQQMPRPGLPGPWVSNFYDGSDQCLKSLLHKKASEAFPPSIPEFGPRVGGPPVRPAPARSTHRSPVEQTIRKWRPEGTLIAHFAEHRGCVNQLLVAPDHSFFVSCSDDGTVKIWDCARLEKNVSNRAWATYSAQGGRITCMVFIQHTYCVAAASDNGTIHVICVEQGSSSSHKYRKYRVVRKSRMEGDYVVAIEHVNIDTRSLLLCATARNLICAIDLRTMKAAWSMQNPAHFGAITCFVADSQTCWLLVGTARGVLALWDMRFRLLLRSWMHPSRSRIQRLALHPSRAAKGRWVLVAAGRSEVTAWDIDKVECREVYCVGQPDPDRYKPLETPGKRDLEGSGGAGDRDGDDGRVETTASPSTVRAIGFPQNCAYMFAAGGDRKIRCWDQRSAAASYTVCGLEPDEKRAKYQESRLDKLALIYEIPPSSPSAPLRQALSASARANPVSAQQQRLLWNHMDCITDVQVTEVPHPLLISADRGGVIKVWK